MTVTLDIDDDGIATVTIDDGARNALSMTTIADIGQAVASAGEARALVLTGREGSFSAGLDLKHIQAKGPEGARELIRSLGEVVLPLWTDPRPTVCAATGHALAGGTILAMACDHVVAADGPFKWGLIETAVGLMVPHLGLTLAGHRLQPRHVNQYVIPGATVDARTAVSIGYADELAEPADVLDRARAVASERLELPASAYAAMKDRLRGEQATQVAAGSEHDLDQIVRLLAETL